MERLRKSDTAARAKAAVRKGGGGGLESGVFSSRNLWAICAAAETGSVNGAARTLPLSQPALSRIIRKAEVACGRRLFERGYDGIVPTRAGEIFLHRARRAIDYLAMAERALPAARARRPVLHRVVLYRHLRAAIEIGRCRSVSLAAVRLGVTQPAVHRSLRELEGVVGEPLFERRYRRMVPTRTGETLLRYFKLAMAELRHCESELASEDGAVCGRVRIGILPLLQTALVPATIAGLAGEHPRLRFSMVDGSYESLLADLRAGEIDLLVGQLRNPPPVGGVVEEPLFGDALSIVARAGHPLTRRCPLRVAELSGFGWVVPPEGTLIRDCFERLFHDAGMAVPDDLVEASSAAAVRSLLIESGRLAIISRGRIRHEEHWGVLVSLPLALPGGTRVIGVTTREDAVHPPGVRACLNRLRALAAETAVTARAQGRSSSGFQSVVTAVRSGRARSAGRSDADPM